MQPPALEDRTAGFCGFVDFALVRRPFGFPITATAAGYCRVAVGPAGSNAARDGTVEDAATLLRDATGRPRVAFGLLSSHRVAA